MYQRPCTSFQLVFTVGRPLTQRRLLPGFYKRPETDRIAFFGGKCPVGDQRSLLMQRRRREDDHDDSRSVLVRNHYAIPTHHPERLRKTDFRTSDEGWLCHRRQTNTTVAIDAGTTFGFGGQLRGVHCTPWQSGHRPSVGLLLISRRPCCRRVCWPCWCGTLRYLVFDKRSVPIVHYSSPDPDPNSGASTRKNGAAVFDPFETAKGAI